MYNKHTMFDIVVQIHAYTNKTTYTGISIGMPKVCPTLWAYSLRLYIVLISRYAQGMPKSPTHFANIKQ